MFFRHDYSTPGPGIEKDAPEKTGVSRFVEILQLECVTLFQLNLLFLLTCLPVVTIPLALYAMNQVVRRMVLDQPVLLLHHYTTALRRGWGRAYLAFFLTALPMGCSLWGAWFYLGYAAENPVFFVPFLFCSTVFLAATLASGCLYGLLGAGMEMGKAVRLALLLGIGRPLRPALTALVWYGILLAAVLAFPLSAPYLLLIGFSAPCLLGNFYLRTILNPCCPAEAADRPEETAKP